MVCWLWLLVEEMGVLVVVVGRVMGGMVREGGWGDGVEVGVCGGGHGVDGSVCGRGHGDDGQCVCVRRGEGVEL